jgi:type VI secretion system protein ImpC
MPERSSVGFEINVQSKPSGVAVGEEEPFRIAVFGDFSGRANRGVQADTASVRGVAIDRDNFDAVLAKCAPALELSLGDSGPNVALSFSSLDDFHPDSLYQRLPLFAKLREARKAPRAHVAAAPRTSAPQTETPRPSGGSLLDQMVEQPGVPAPRHPARPDDLQAFIDRVLVGHVVPGKDPEQEELVARVDAAISEQMRAILHHPDFQALESAWRGLYFLVRRLETGVDLQVCFFDVSRQDLRDDLSSTSDLRDTTFYRRVAASQANAPWALLVGNYSFDASPEDIELLALIAMVANSARAPFLSAARPSVIGCPSMQGMADPREWEVDPTSAQFWQTLRELPEAASLGMLMPRFLLRLPYGEDTSSTETFPFEEVSGAPAHESYLWGNPAFAAACLLGSAFSRDGWQMRPDSTRDIDRLPLHTYRHDGEAVSQPCAEAWLSDRAAQIVLEHGVMPLLSARDGDRVLLLRFQSVAHPPKALAGRW